MATIRDVIEALNDIEMVLEGIEQLGTREQVRNLLNAIRRAISLRYGG